MKTLWQLSGVAALALVLAGCFGNNGSNGTADNDNGMTPKVDFTTFVKNQINNPTVDRDPVSINNKEFVFNDQDNQQAYNDLF